MIRKTTKFYRIEQARTLDDLAKKVNDIIIRNKTSWYPIGAVFTYNDVGVVYCQAMGRRYVPNRQPTQAKEEKK